MQISTTNDSIQQLQKDISAAVDRAWQHLRLNNDLNGEVQTRECTQILMTAFRAMTVKLAELEGIEARHEACRQALRRIALLKGKKLRGGDFIKACVAHETESKDRPGNNLRTPPRGEGRVRG